MLENNIENKKSTPKNITAEVRFLLFRIIAVIILILMLTFFKYAMPSVFKDVKTYYNEVLSVDVNPDDILSESEKS